MIFELKQKKYKIFLQVQWWAGTVLRVPLASAEAVDSSSSSRS